MTTSIFATADQNPKGIYFLLFVMGLFLGGSLAVAQEASAIVEVKRSASHTMQELHLSKAASNKSSFLSRIEELDATSAAHESERHQTTQADVVAQSGTAHENESIAQKRIDFILHSQCFESQCQ